MTEHHIEIEGKHYVCQKRVQEVPVPHPPGALAKETQYSFDQGQTWFSVMYQAFKHAQEQGTLMRIGEQVGEAGEFEAFVLTLVQEIQGLRPGERLQVVRDQDTVFVAKEQAVLAVRASTVKEIDLRIQEGQDGGS